MFHPQLISICLFPVTDPATGKVKVTAHIKPGTPTVDDALKNLENNEDTMEVTDPAGRRYPLADEGGLKEYLLSPGKYYSNVCILICISW